MLQLSVRSALARKARKKAAPPARDAPNEAEETDGVRRRLPPPS